MDEEQVNRIMTALKKIAAELAEIKVLMQQMVRKL